MAEVSADDGCRLWVERLDPHGADESLMLCHGGPGLWDMFGTVADRLSAAARVVRWDQRGCGRSERRGPYTIARSIADLDTVRERLATDRVTLLGHSWGATLALLYALERPDRVSRLIYVCGVGIDAEQPWLPIYQENLRRRLGDRYGRWAELRDRSRTAEEEREIALLRWSADFADPDTAPAHARQQAMPWFGVNRDCATALLADTARYFRVNDVAERCRSLDVPTLIIQGAGDLRPRSVVDSLHRALPRVERVVLDGGHVPWVEDPEGFASAVFWPRPLAPSE